MNTFIKSLKNDLSGRFHLIFKHKKLISLFLISVLILSASTFAIVQTKKSQSGIFTVEDGQFTKQEKSDKPQTIKVAAKQPDKSKDSSIKQEDNTNETLPEGTKQNPVKSAPSSGSTKPRDNSTALPKVIIPTGIKIGSVTRPTYQYVYFTANGFTANQYYFVLTPIKTSKPTSVNITQNYIESYTPTNNNPVTQNGKGNPQVGVGRTAGDLFYISVCNGAGYLKCGKYMSNKIKAKVVTDHEASGHFTAYKFKYL